MRVVVSYSVEEFNQFNDASEGWKRGTRMVSIDDGGKALGELIVGLLASSAEIENVKLA